MNERIEELFKRAGGKTSIHNLMSNPMQQREYRELWDDRIEKFAELIVRECCLQVADVRIENEFEPVGDAVLVQALVGIKRHFGVEE